ncbi:NfeD family protein [Hephaestia sp. GCM10023244]|uniref:NfeD family protein n=1 Tax=unclassified Hephaestia TaxID=2631281 RepID=UPI00207711C5|nr:NfeD family protein [Hephaestia sp. MAHUQ-44]MCM8731371.1 NfeD family protein [Hephaestia sp. MAHUQ-44]
MTLDALLGEAGWLWLILAVGLGIAELMVPGVFLIFLAIAAAITGVATLVLADLSPVAQFASFGIWAAVAVLIGKRWYRDYPVESSDPLLNDRVARLIGEIVVVTDAIENGAGRVRVGDGSWPAHGPDTAVGRRVRVTGVDGSALLTEPADD